MAIAATKEMGERTMQNKELRQWCFAEQGNFLKDLCTLVETESPTGDAEGSEKMTERMGSWLRELGAEVRILQTPVGCYNLVAVFKGEGTRKILLNAHADTVFKKGTLESNPFRVEDGKVYGPGCIDCKGGLVLGVYALRFLKKLNFKDYEQITFVMNADEETGSENSKELIMEQAKIHDLAIVLEAAKPDHGACIGRKGLGSAIIEVNGKSVHAARASQGANALEELAHQVMAFRTLGDENKGTAVNVTVFSAGEVANTIPDYAMAKVDIRVDDTTEFDRIEREAAVLVANTIIPGTQVTFSLKAHPAFPKNYASIALAKQLEQIYTAIGVKMVTVTSPGVSDANYIASVGPPVIDGMSFVGMNAHTKDEVGYLDSLPDALFALTKFLMCVQKP